MKQPTMDYDRSPEVLPALLRQMKQPSNAEPVEWRLGRYTFRWERQGNVGRMVVTGIPGRVLPFVMLVETPEKARFYAPALVRKLDAGGLPTEGVFRRLDGAGVHSGALIAMAKGIPVMSDAGDENDGEDDDDGDDGDDIGVRTAYQGIPLKIDFPKGVYREGVDRNGAAWSKQMRCDYGEVDGLVTGADGDRVDVYVGDEVGAPNVYVIDQVDPETKSFDEQKFMLGFTSADAAKRMYLKHVPAGSCGRVAVFPIERFKAWLEASIGQPSAILKGMVTTATVAPAVPDSAEEGPVKVRHHVRVMRKDNGFHEIRFRPPSTRKRPTMRPSAIELDPSLADEGMTGLRGYTRKGDWAYRDTRLNKLLAKGLDEATATEQMRKRAMKRHAKTVDYPAGSFTATMKGQKISGPVSFLTNDDGNVFPVSTSSPKAAKALNTPLHRKIMAKIIGSTTGANGGDYTKYVGHFAELHKDDAKGKTHEEFTQHLVDRIKEHSGNADLGAALKASLHEEAGKHVGATSALVPKSAQVMASSVQHADIGTPGSKRSARVSGGRVYFSYSYDPEINSALKSAFPNMARFDSGTKTWSIPADAEHINALKRFAERNKFYIPGAAFAAMSRSGVSPTPHPTPYDNERITIGQHAGKTWAQMAETSAGREWLQWLSREGRDDVSRSKARIIYDAKVRGIAPAVSPGTAKSTQSSPALSSAPSASERAMSAKRDVSAFPVPKIMEGGLLSQGGAQMHPYQNSGVNWMVTAKRGILADEMGLGKSVQAIAAASRMKELGETSGALFVVPSGTIHNWKLEMEKWAPNAKVIVIDGSPKKRDAAYAEAAKGFDFVIAPYSMVQKESDKLKAINGPNVAKFADEAHRMKGWDTQVNKNFKSDLSSGPTILMTGTPMPNRPEELYSLMNIANPGVLGSFTSFKNKYAVTVSQRIGGGRSIEKVVGYKNLNELRERVAPYMRAKRRSDADVANALPPALTVSPVLEMTSEQRTMYNDAKAGALNILKTAVNKSGTTDGGSAANVLTQLMRMKQIALTPELVDPTWTSGSPKITEMVDRIEEHHSNNPDKGVVVFSEFNATFPILQRELKERGYQSSEFATISGDVSTADRAKAQDDLNAGKLKVLFVATKAGGEGLNLQKNATMVVHATTPWNPAVLDQATARVDRQGRADNIMVLRPSMKDGIDEKIEGFIKRKRGLTSAVMGGGPDNVSSETGGLSHKDLLEILETK